jgi:hypothetical protein
MQLDETAKVTKKNAKRFQLITDPPWIDAQYSARSVTEKAQKLGSQETRLLRIDPRAGESIAVFNVLCSGNARYSGCCVIRTACSVVFTEAFYERTRLKSSAFFH